MRKSILGPEPASTAPTDARNHAWLDLEHLARVEVTSEDELFPIEHALGLEVTTGWRAANPGPQSVRILFDTPQTIRQVDLHIVDRAAERTQELALYAGPSPDDLREVLRQQFTFSPAGSTEEVEHYSVDLTGVIVLDLRIDPDRSHDPAQSINYATLQSLRIA